MYVRVYVSVFRKIYFSTKLRVFLLSFPASRYYYLVWGRNRNATEPLRAAWRRTNVADTRQTRRKQVFKKKKSSLKTQSQQYLFIPQLSEMSVTIVKCFRLKSWHCDILPGPILFVVSSACWDGKFLRNHFIRIRRWYSSHWLVIKRFFLFLELWPCGIEYMHILQRLIDVSYCA